MQAYRFFARFCQEKKESDPKSAVEDYFKQCLGSYFTTNKKERDGNKPNPVHLARALFLLAQGERMGDEHVPR